MSDRRLGPYVALDLVGGVLRRIYSDDADQRHTYLVGLDEAGEVEPGAATVLINLTDDQRAQWADVLREVTP